MTYFLVCEDQDYPSGFKVFYPDINCELEKQILQDHKIFFDDCTRRMKQYSMIPVNRYARICGCKLNDISNIFIQFGYTEYIE